MVTAPGQHVHGQGRSIRELEEEDLVPGDLLDRRRVMPAREDVEAVEADSDRGMVGELDDPPRTSVVVDESSPGEGFVRQAYAVHRSLVAEPAQLRGRHLVVVDGGGADVAADQHGVDPEALHEAELRLRPSQHVAELLVRDAFGIAERLVEVEGQAQSACQRGDLLGLLRRADQVGLEDLDAVEPGLRAGMQLLDQGAAQADRRDRRAQAHLSSSPRALGPRVSSRAGLTTSSWWMSSSVAPPDNRRGTTWREMFSMCQLGTWRPATTVASPG